jgi:hypothetical protein
VCAKKNGSDSNRRENEASGPNGYDSLEYFSLPPVDLHMRRAGTRVRDLSDRAKYLGAAMCRIRPQGAGRSCSAERRARRGLSPTTREATPMMQHIDIGCADYELALDAIATYISIADKIRDPIL